MIKTKTMILFRDKVKKQLSRKGVSRKWLSEQLGITTVSLYRKITKDSFTTSERFYVSHLLGLNNE